MHWIYFIQCVPRPNKLMNQFLSHVVYNIAKGRLSTSICIYLITNEIVVCLSGEERDLRLNEASFERAATLLRRVPEFTVAVALRQDEANSGTIVAFSHGNNRYDTISWIRRDRNFTVTMCVCVCVCVCFERKYWIIDSDD